jgi:hypothetical protein
METVSKTQTLNSFGSWSLCEYIELFEQAHSLQPFDNRASSHLMKLALYKIIDAMVDDGITGDAPLPEVLTQLYNAYEQYLRKGLTSTVQCLKILDEMQAVTEKENQKRG